MASLDTSWKFLHWSIWPKCKKTIIGTSYIWDTDNKTDNWEPGFMTIFVTWQLIVTLDSIRNSCDVSKERMMFFFFLNKKHTIIASPLVMRGWTIYCFSLILLSSLRCSIDLSVNGPSKYIFSGNISLLCMCISNYQTEQQKDNDKDVFEILGA